jgi:hypothetical protein
MSLRLRKVPTASGATAVQIVTKRHGKLTVIEHLGSAHTPAQLAALEEAGREKINEVHRTAVSGPRHRKHSPLPVHVDE